MSHTPLTTDERIAEALERIADALVGRPMSAAVGCWGCSGGGVLVGCPVHDPGRGNTQNPSKAPHEAGE